MSAPTRRPFIKMHGAGNDFVVIDRRKGGREITAELARAVGDRHRGVGFDQLAELQPCEDADFRLIFWNSDGSQAGACGNATRCVSALVMRETGQDSLTIRTARGLLKAEKRDGQIWVNMGAPLLNWAEIPLAQGVNSLELPLEGRPTAVGMGNPHAVHFVENAEAIDLEGWGARVEHDPLFPERTNVEFAHLIGLDHLRMRVWERGAGVTLACGSGACATAVAANLRGMTGKRVALDLDGGRLEVDWREDGVWLTGPVAWAFEGLLAEELER